MNMAENLANKTCAPCDGDGPALSAEAAKELLAQVPGWELSDDATSISRTYKFKDFAEALAFTNNVGALVEREGHHPDIELSWGKVVLTFFTHSIGGLSENDFIVAAKINKLN